MLTDSHTHLYLEEFESDGGGKAAVERALNAGVRRLMFPNVSLDTITPMKRLASEFPDVVDMAMGLHPTEVNNDWKGAIEAIKSELSTGKYKAVGEIGIDLYWDRTYRAQQIEAFEAQCELAVNHELPVIIHCREGLSEILDAFDHMKVMPHAVFHSFGGSSKDIEAIRLRGDFFFGINGIVTFKNSGLKNVLHEIGLERILLETDSPYLSPVPLRGRRNESAYIVHTAGFVAHMLGLPAETVAEQTSRNYLNFLNQEQCTSNN